MDEHGMSLEPLLLLLKTLTFPRFYSLNEQKLLKSPQKNHPTCHGYLQICQWQVFRLQL